MNKTDRIKSQCEAQAPAKPGTMAKREFQPYACLRLDHNLHRFLRYAARVGRQPAHVRWLRQRDKLQAAAKLRRHRMVAEA